jgi:hypothetical protein
VNVLCEYGLISGNVELKQKVVSLMSVLRTLYGCGQSRALFIDWDGLERLTLVDARGEKKKK